MQQFVTTHFLIQETDELIPCMGVGESGELVTGMNPCKLLTYAAWYEKKFTLIPFAIAPCYNTGELILKVFGNPVKFQVVEATPEIIKEFQSQLFHKVEAQLDNLRSLQNRMMEEYDADVLGEESFKLYQKLKEIN